MTNQIINDLSRERAKQVWHQDSPGIQVWVIRGPWGRLFKSKEFSSLGEKTYPTKPWGFP